MENYILYLLYIQKKLDKYFEDQKPYIRCAKGCSKCCEHGDFPYKRIEMEYLLLGFSMLSLDKRQIICEKIERLKQEKQNSQTENFVHECPFLIDNSCSVYDFRGMICRSFGLMTLRENKKPQIPFCAFEGLNYAEVLDAETKTISSEKFEELGIETEPLAYNTGYKALTSEIYENAFLFKFGELKPMIDWFIDDSNSSSQAKPEG